MADLFGDWVPWEWIKAVLDTVRACPHRTFQFLTKNTKRLKDFNPWPKNCWVGTTVTDQEDADERLPWLVQVDAPVLFISHEPLLGPIKLTDLSCPGEAQPFWASHGPFKFNALQDDEDHYYDSERHIGWGIIGSMTGLGATKPEPEWVRNLWEQYRAAGVPVFMKENLKPIMGTLVQEWPCREELPE